MSKSDHKHTELPWKIHEYGPLNEAAVISGATGRHITIVYEGVNTPEIDRINAKFIVEACNSHDRLQAINAKLLEALKLGLRGLEDARTELFELDGEMVLGTSGYVKGMKAAIALATESEVG